MGRALLSHPRLVEVNRLSIFLSPLSKDEIAYLKAPERNVSLQELLTDIMRRKLLGRTRRQKGELAAKDLENVETRASSAYRELQEAWHLAEYVIPNHDGEDSDNWEAFYYLIGDARKTLGRFRGLAPRLRSARRREVAARPLAFREQGRNHDRAAGRNACGTGRPASKSAALIRRGPPVTGNLALWGCVVCDACAAGATAGTD